MSVTINVNDLSLVHKGSAGFARATLPDVCRTPSPGGPVPVPYPNLARSADLAKGTTTVLADGGNSVAIYGSEFAASTGDEPGTLGGVKSGTFKKEATWLSFSFDVRVEGANACRLTDKMLMNHGNTVCLGGEIQAFIDILVTLGELDALCEIFCYCLSTGGNQACVAEKISQIDAATAGQSPLLAEIPYNMTTSPPRPMMSTENPRRGSTNWPFPNHPEHPEGFVPGTGMVRRPDVVIVDNPTLPPGGANLRAVVEMKFPNDPNHWNSENMQIRERDYQRIATENNPSAPYVRIDKDVCGCDDEGHRSPRYVPVPIPERRWAPEAQRQRRSPSPPLGAPAPASSFEGLGEAALGLLEMAGGAGLFGVSAVGSAALVADDLTGIGVLDDPALVVTGGGMVAGGGMVLDGQRRWSSGIRKIFGW
ncbi:DUF4150 domain-containing protein [Sorangium sp. So ce429]